MLLENYNTVSNNGKARCLPYNYHSPSKFVVREKIRQRNSQINYMCQKPLSKEEIIVAFHNNHYNFKKTKIFDPS